MELTLVITKGKDGYLIGKIKELPSVLTQGNTVEEVKENILDALKLYLDDVRSDNSDRGNDFVAEELLIVA
jgi:predicted RNase H-like HicB family nuclease